MASNFNPFGHGYSLMPPYYTVGENGQRLIPPTNYIRGLQGMPSHRPELNTNFLEFDDPSRPVLPAQGSARVRRRVGAGGEHVKFRRTRSGCYTCRTRRVKCDEARPICERCRKGSRECVYPEQSTPTKTRRGSSKEKSGEGDGSSQEDESDAIDTGIPPDEDELILEADEPASATAQKSRSPLRASSDPPSLIHEKSLTPSTEDSANVDVPSVKTSRRPDGRSQSVQLAPSNKWSQLPQDMRFYLNYARTKLTPYHWCFKYFEASFLRTTLLEVAVRFEPLLYAVVGFAAYHHTLTKTNGKLHDFLDYYNKSVSLLRLSLKKNEKHTIATLLTILQLATIEEYLGDWVNCVGHQSAAYQILTELYTPQQVVENESLRMILQWYIHFDVFAGMISGNGTILGMEWFKAQHDWDSQLLAEKPDDINIMYRERFSRFRLLAADMAIMFARKGKNAISEEEFDAKCKVVAAELANWGEALDPALRDPSKLVTDFSEAPLADPDDIVDPFDPKILYGGDLFPTNHLTLQISGLHLMFLYQYYEMHGKPRPPQVQELALKMCQLIEAIEYYPGSPPSILLGVQANLGIAAAFLPVDEKHTLWARKKLAAMETLGYVYPARYRMRLSQQWNVDLSDWWLPNDEGRPPIIRHIREFIADRTATPRHAKEEDVLEMKGLYNSLCLSNSASPESLQEQSKQSPPHLRRTTSDPTGRQSDVDFKRFGSSIPATANIEEDAMIFGNSPEFEWGYEQQSWEGF